VAALVHLKSAEEFSAVMEASKSKSRPKLPESSGSQVAPSVYLRSQHFVMHAGALPAHHLLAQASQATHPAIGVIIPKRWAKRAVTRNTFKRQFYAVAQTYAQPLTELLPGCGLVLRQTSAFDKKEFVSASSPALRATVRQELQDLFGRLFSQLSMQPVKTKSAGVAA
jgi:ribonuclease P protein component